MLLLSYFGHAWVWGGAEPDARIPAAIAVPWCAVAARLGRPPILSYASYALDNWRRLDPSGPLELGNLAILQNFLGGADEDWFILVHLEIEARAAPRAARARARQRGRRGERRARARGAARARSPSGIESLCQSLGRMPELCDPYVYYRRVRPYIHGWKDHPLLPDGVVYEGVAEHGGRPQRLRGETGAQSGIVPALDAALGVEHAGDPLRAYLAEMRDYMPPGHREFARRRRGRARRCARSVAALGRRASCAPPTTSACAGSRRSAPRTWTTPRATSTARARPAPRTRPPSAPAARRSWPTCASTATRRAATGWCS